MQDDELKHYGVLGMKWGVRRATYKLRSSGSLKKSKAKVEKDITTIQLKANRQKRRAAKAQKRAANYMQKGNFRKSAKYFKKSSKKTRHAQKRERTEWHNKELLKLYDKRIKELDSNTKKKGHNAINKVLNK